MIPFKVKQHAIFFYFCLSHSHHHVTSPNVLVTSLNFNKNPIVLDLSLLKVCIKP